MLRALRIVSWTTSVPSEITVTSLPAFLSRNWSAASTAHASKSFMSNLRPASSTDVLSALIRKRTSMSGTRLTHTAIFTAESPCERFHIKIQRAGSGKREAGGGRREAGGGRREAGGEKLLAQF